MRGYFDEDEPEPEQPRRDPELTLGTGAVLGLALVLVLVCGLCFAAGYAVGHRAPAAPQQPMRPPRLPIRSRCNPTTRFPSLQLRRKRRRRRRRRAIPRRTPDASANPSHGATEPGAGQQAYGQSGRDREQERPGAAQPVQPALPAGRQHDPRRTEGERPMCVRLCRLRRSGWCRLPRWRIPRTPTCW